MKKILFVVDENKMGGVSVVLETILNKLDYSNKSVDLLILHNSGNCLKNIPKEIKVIYGGKFFNIIDLSLKEIIKNKEYSKLFKKIWFIFLMKTKLINRKIIKERKKLLSKNYDIEIAFKFGFSTLFTYLGNSVKKINWVHGDCKINDPCLKYRKIFKCFLNKFDYNVTLSKSINKNFNDIYNCEGNSIIINNMIDEDKIKSCIKNANYIETEYIKFVAVGRLSYVKGYHLLIEALKLIRDDGLIEKLRLNIIGDGEEFTKLTNLVNKYDLSKYIRFLGNKTPPYAYIKESDCLILSSLSEAYPLVIIESFLSGVPVLTTKIASIDEMVLNNINAIIVDTNIQGLYKGIKDIILDPTIICQMKKNLNNYQYNNDIILKEINNILK